MNTSFKHLPFSFMVLKVEQKTRVVNFWSLRPATVVKEALKLLRASLPTTIEIVQKTEADSGMVLADPTQIHQVLMNLCTNAAHAMHDKGGVLGVSLEDVDLDTDSTTKQPDLKPGPCVKLTVSDTGHGMDSTVLDKVFDPFFTTKERGEGTGMGLAAVHGIVKSHGGGITVDSVPGKGTVFAVFFPRIQRSIPAEAAAPSKPLPTGNEQVLLVDDEKTVLDSLQKLMEQLGYKVVARTSSIEALEAFRAEPNKFEVVITDQTMPNMTGAELAEELIQIRPDIPIILCTGFSSLVSKEEAHAMGIKAFVMKPIVSRDLAHTIRKVLDENGEFVD